MISYFVGGPDGETPMVSLAAKVSSIAWRSKAAPRPCPWALLSTAKRPRRIAGRRDERAGEVHQPAHHLVLLAALGLMVVFALRKKGG